MNNRETPGDSAQPEPASFRKVSSRAFLVDLALYLPVMFLIREIYFQNLGFMVNGLFWSFTTLIVAAWRMRARGISWAEIGLCKPGVSPDGNNQSTLIPLLAASGDQDHAVRVPHFAGIASCAHQTRSA